MSSKFTDAKKNHKLTGGELDWDVGDGVCVGVEGRGRTFNMSSAICFPSAPLLIPAMIAGPTIILSLFAFVSDSDG